MKKINAKEITYSALFILLMSLSGGFLKVIAPFLPFSLQPIVAIAAGFILRPFVALLCQISYLALGLLGLPVFTQGGGLGYIYNPSFGYIIGFLLCSVSVSLLSKKFKKKDKKTSLIITFAGITVIYLVGIPYMYYILRYYTGNTDFTFIAAITGNIVYFIKDAAIVLVLQPSLTYLNRLFRI